MASMVMQPRINELTAVSARSLFDAVPDGTAQADVPRWHEFRRRYHQAAQLEWMGEFPLQIDFELNSTCQMKCAFCVHGQGKVPKRELSYALFCHVIDEGQKYGLCSIKLNYINEPLLRRDLPQFVRYAKSRGVLNVYFATNGLLLTPKVARELIDCGVTKIMISLDAVTAETFQAMRHSPHFEKIVGNVRNLLRMRGAARFPLVRVNFVKTSINAHEADAFLAEWQGVADMIGYQDQVAVPGVENEIKQRAGFRCSFPYKMMVIDSSGSILPCCTFSGRLIPMGHISTSTVKQAWDSFAMRRLKLIHKNGLYKSEQVCAECMGA